VFWDNKASLLDPALLPRDCESTIDDILKSHELLEAKDGKQSEALKVDLHDLKPVAMGTALASIEKCKTENQVLGPTNNNEHKITLACRSWLDMAVLPSNCKTTTEVELQENVFHAYKTIILVSAVSSNSTVQREQQDCCQTAGSSRPAPLLTVSWVGNSKNALQLTANVLDDKRSTKALQRALPELIQFGLNPKQSTEPVQSLSSLGPTNINSEAKCPDSGVKVGTGKKEFESSVLVVTPAEQVSVGVCIVVALLLAAANKHGNHTSSNAIVDSKLRIKHTLNRVKSLWGAEVYPSRQLVKQLHRHFLRQ